MSAFTIPVRVYIEDTDAGGIVFYVNYLKFFERARTELFRSLGYNKPAFIEKGKLLVVSSANISYKKPAYLDDELTVSAQVIKRKNTYLVFQQEINKESELLCESEIKIACVDAQTMRPAVIPKDILSAIDSSM